ncbi:Ig-like domain-containing protein [Taibaiella koreensis]|uniref:Ig-like domain-containing protein n=1 Tax=Taibaiella koreensis TaxID=1268548 RepID=UPI0013C2AC7E|nr:Ig-like domain-containing protein [Taibaiella koreensis]
MKTRFLSTLFTALLSAMALTLEAQPVANGKVRNTTEDATTNITATTSTANLLNGATGSGLSITGYTINGMPGTYDTGTVVTILYPAATDTVGTINIHNNGNYQFIPKPNYNDTVPLITYTVKDVNNLTDTAILKILIRAVNDGTANTIPSYNVREDSSLVINRSINGAPLIWEEDVDAGYGQFTISFIISDGNNLIFTPDPAFGTLTATSTDSVTVTGSGTAQVVLTGSLPALNAYLHDGNTAASPPITYLTPGADANYTCLRVRITMTADDHGNTGDPGFPVVARTDTTSRIITIGIMADIRADNLNASGVAPLPFNPITGTGGASADNFESALRYMSAINGAAFTNGQVVTLPSGNSITVDTTGDITFTAASGFSGVDSFTYTVSPGGNGCPETAKISINVSTTLPVELVRFTAVEQAPCQVVLSWLTGKEEHLREFTVEWSKDGKYFVPAGIVPAKGSGNSYQYIPDHAGEGAAYYRLKMTDLDGSFRYSPVVSLIRHCGAAYKVKVYPTYTNGKVQVEGLREGDELTLYDGNGRRILQRKATGAAIQYLDLEHNIPGMYYLILTDVAGGKSSYKLIRE